MLRLPPCPCSVLIVNIDSPRISVHFAVVILRPPCSVVLRVPVDHAPMLHMTDHRPFPPRSIAIHRPCFRSSFQTLRSRFHPLTPPCQHKSYFTSSPSAFYDSQSFVSVHRNLRLSPPLDYTSVFHPPSRHRHLAIL